MARNLISVMALVVLISGCVPITKVVAIKVPKIPAPLDIRVRNNTFIDRTKLTPEQIQALLSTYSKEVWIVDRSEAELQEYVFKAWVKALKEQHNVIDKANNYE